jgi:aminoglycoside 3-N-acetyltransferase
MNDHSGEARAIAKTDAELGGPVTHAVLVQDLCALRIPAGRPIIIHSSLSALGWVAGGPVAVVDALVDAFGPASTLVVPTQSGEFSDPVHWQNPPVPDHWLQRIRDETHPYDPCRTPTRGMGRIVEAFRTDPRAVRGPHPTVSFAAIGPLAKHIVGHHPLAPQFGEESPLARLYAHDAVILLLGVTHQSNTSLHLAEHRASWRSKQLTRNDGASLIVDGQRKWLTFADEPADDEGFDQLGEEFASAHTEHRGRVGIGEARWCRMREIVDFGVDWFSTHR